MNRYEILMLSVPEITDDEAKGIEKNLEDTIKTYKGAVISFERWGKYRLAYPVKKHDYGIYFLARFEVSDAPKLFEEIRSSFAVRYNDSIMRHVVMKLDSKQSLEYRRPPMVEDAPTTDVNSFLRKNKMDGLISSDDRRPGDIREGGRRPDLDPIEQEIVQDLSDDEGESV